MINVQDLVKRHGDRTVLHGVSFSARKGRVTGFVGPNGSGKSSTLRILLGLDRPQSGTSTIAGRRYQTIRHPLTRVGSMLDGAGAHPMRTARAHLGWVAASNRIPRRRVNEVLEQVGLPMLPDDVWVPTPWGWGSVWGWPLPFWVSRSERQHSSPHAEHR